jgi:hypothetical protein
MVGPPYIAGLDDPTLKIFMRDAVIVSEYLVYIPAAAIFARRSASSKESTLWTASIAHIAILLLANVGFFKIYNKTATLYSMSSRVMHCKAAPF